MSKNSKKNSNRNAFINIPSDDIGKDDEKEIEIFKINRKSKKETKEKIEVPISKEEQISKVEPIKKKR